jgi:hypothetical protein
MSDLPVIAGTWATSSPAPVLRSVNRGHPVPIEDACQVVDIRMLAMMNETHLFLGYVIARHANEYDHFGMIGWSGDDDVKVPIDGGVAEHERVTGHHRSVPEQVVKVSTRSLISFDDLD